MDLCTARCYEGATVTSNTPFEPKKKASLLYSQSLTSKGGGGASCRVFVIHTHGTNSSVVCRISHDRTTTISRRRELEKLTAVFILVYLD